MTEEVQYTSLGSIVKAQDAPALKKYLAKLKPEDNSKQTIEKHNEMLNLLLWHAAELDSAEIIEILMDEGADPNFINNGKKAIHNSILNGTIEVMKTLVKRGVDINTPDTQGGNGFILLYNNEELELEPSEWGNPSKTNEITETALKTSQALVDLGADVNIKNLAGKTPLHYVAYFGNDYLVDFLIANNADPHAETLVDECTPSEYVPEDNEALFQKLEKYKDSYNPSHSGKMKI